MKTETPLSPEEEEAKRLEEEEKGKKKKKGEKKKAKKKGKKGDKDDDKVQTVKIGPSEVVQKFDEFYEDYNNVWANKDEVENYLQHHENDMAKDTVRPTVEEEF